MLFKQQSWTKCMNHEKCLFWGWMLYKFIWNAPIHKIWWKELEIQNLWEEGLLVSSALISWILKGTGSKSQEECTDVDDVCEHLLKKEDNSLEFVLFCIKNASCCVML